MDAKQIYDKYIIKCEGSSVLKTDLVNLYKSKNGSDEGVDAFINLFEKSNKLVFNGYKIISEHDEGEKLIQEQINIINEMFINDIIKILEIGIDMIKRKYSVSEGNEKIDAITEKWELIRQNVKRTI